MTTYGIESKDKSGNGVKKKKKEDHQNTTDGEIHILEVRQDQSQILFLRV